ncbi:pilus assembly FimT family protein [Litorilituus sediminis]|uniref:Type II secretion system protein n=1 Tax=Litorilituus sediminis TaxID=718192 RepID=A0A4P6PAF8_9GAMM|nr:type II secretion system protein [Litorilituus sediminis]QBG36605.1 type II secretion system protein [Litorilituus sediminis]
MNLQRGFTLIELVTVIILIGILAVNVLPKFGGTASYEAHTHRAQLISALRLTQQRAMQQTDLTAVDKGTVNERPYCHHIVFDDRKYGVPDRLNCNERTFNSGWDKDKDITGHEVDSRYEISFAVQGAAKPALVSFDWMGRPLGDCDGGCTIEVTSAVETLEIIIEAEGYIHAN